MVSSVIYFAREYPVTSCTRFKIGESSRGEKRQKDANFPQNHIINDIYITKEDTKSYRVALEGLLRLYIERHYNCQRVGLDTFIGKDYRTILKIKNDFPYICENLEKKLVL